MARQRIINAEEGAVLVLAPEMLDQLGLHGGDEIDVAVVDRTVVLRPLDEMERARTLHAVTQAILKRRKQVYIGLTDEPT